MVFDKACQINKKGQRTHAKSSVKRKRRRKKKKEKAMMQSKREQLASSQGIMQKCCSTFSYALKHLLIFAIAFVFASMYISQNKVAPKS